MEGAEDNTSVEISHKHHAENAALDKINIITNLLFHCVKQQSLQLCVHHFMFTTTNNQLWQLLSEFERAAAPSTANTAGCYRCSEPGLMLHYEKSRCFSSSRSFASLFCCLLMSRSFVFLALFPIIDFHDSCHSGPYRLKVNDAAAWTKWQQTVRTLLLITFSQYRVTFAGTSEREIDRFNISASL
ncbi:uncharacterized protein V6R79_022758 [Siganus canaliculatus]